MGAELTALPAVDGEGAERGVAIVRCALPNDTFWISRAAVLNVGNPRAADVLMTTAHGLPSDEQSVLRQCHIVVRGKTYSIRALWRSGGHGHADDWAVLASRRLPASIPRLRPGSISRETLSELVHQAAPVRLVLRYTTQSACRLEPRPSAPWPLLPHSCPGGYPGVSGSPLAIGVGGELVVIGIHVGTMTQFGGSALEFAGVGRALDAEIGNAIAAAAAWAGKRRR
jgi:hypothetical protein